MLPLGPALLCFLLVCLVGAAPRPAALSAAPRLAAAERAKTLVEKILKDVEVAHAAAITTQGLDLDSPTADLQLMVTTLGIPTPPVLKPLSGSFTLEVSMRRMASGVRLHQRILGVLSVRVDGLGDLQVDLRDLQTRIAKMREAEPSTGLDQDQNQVQDQDQNQDQDQDQDPGLDLASRLHGDYEVQVATHLTLTQLRSFCYDLNRSLRAAAAQRATPTGR